MASLLELSEITGEGEGCSSTESGWTIYLASPLDDDDDDNLHDDDAEVNGEIDSDISVEFQDSSGENKVEEDDSLASDASTGNIERDVTTLDNYHTTDSNHSTNIKGKSEKMERKEQKRCFGGLFKRGGSSSSCSSKWKTKLTW